MRPARHLCTLATPVIIGVSGRRLSLMNRCNVLHFLYVIILSRLLSLKLFLVRRFHFPPLFLLVSGHLKQHVEQPGMQATGQQVAANQPGNQAIRSDRGNLQEFLRKNECMRPSADLVKNLKITLLLSFL